MKSLAADPISPHGATRLDPRRSRETYEPILECVRAELSEHGGLLNLLSQQGEAIQSLAWEEASRLGRLIEGRRGTLCALRRNRGALLALVVPEGQNPRSLLQVTRHFPEPMRPLVEGITAEVNRLTIQVRLRWQKNRALIGRILQAHPAEGALRVYPQRKTHTSPAGHGARRALASMRI